VQACIADVNISSEILRLSYFYSASDIPLCSDFLSRSDQDRLWVCLTSGAWSYQLSRLKRAATLTWDTRRNNQLCRPWLRLRVSHNCATGMSLYGLEVYVVVVCVRRIVFWNIAVSISGWILRKLIVVSFASFGSHSLTLRLLIQVLQDLVIRGTFSLQQVSLKRIFVDEAFHSELKVLILQAETILVYIWQLTQLFLLVERAWLLLTLIGFWFTTWPVLEGGVILFHYRKHGFDSFAEARKYFVLATILYKCFLHFIYYFQFLFRAVK